MYITADVIPEPGRTSGFAHCQSQTATVLKTNFKTASDSLFLSSNDERPRKVRIHPSSIISSLAKIGKDVEIGPLCIVEEDVYIGNGCRLEARVSIKSGTVLGENNQVSEGAVLGGVPQHLAGQEVCGQLIIGNGNIFRENVTVHRAMKEGEATVIGDNNMMMVNTHAAHDCRLGDHIVLANNAMLAGHVSVGDRANISGAVGVHQFCRIGSFAMVGGQSHIIQDVPPFMTVDGLTSRIVGLNLIGLRRAGSSVEEIKQLKAAYRILFRSQLPWREILKSLEESFTKGLALELIQFLRSTTRGIVSERRSSPPKAALKLHDAEDDEISEQSVSTIPLKISVG